MKGRILVEDVLKEVKRERGGFPRDLHITRMCGALVAVSDEEVIKVTDTKMRYCPLANSLYDWTDIFKEPCVRCMKEGISRALRSKITQFGHFTKKRELLRNDIAIPFGASEMIMYGLQRKGIEAAVTVCDGAGTIITAEPSLVQGIGARMNGLFYTSPVKEVIRRIGENHGFILCPRTAAIDQISGIKKAVELGYRKVAVTINGFAGEDLHKVREVERQTNSFVTILVVCTTGVERERAEEIGEYADLVWSCASLHVRDVVGKRATLQIAVKIPVFVLTRRGIDFVSYYSSPEFGKSIEEGKRYIIMGHLKSNVHNPKKIRMDNFDTYLGEIDQLPSRVEDEPRPLT